MEINNRDYWIKVVGMCQQNWALIAHSGSNNAIYFMNDHGDIFDQIEFISSEAAILALRKNGFSLFAKDSKTQEFIAPPSEPFSFNSHPNGKIYSSGQYWK